MKILSRYLLREFSRAAAACVAGAVTLFVAIDLVERANDLLRSRTGAAEVALYYLFRLPGIFVAVAPVAILLAVLITVSLRGRANELTAMFSSGLSLARVGAPLIGGCAIVALLSLAVAEAIVPSAEHRAGEIARGRMREGKAAAQFSSNRYWLRGEDAIFSAQVVDPRTGVLQGFQYFEIDNGFRLVRRVDARSARLEGKGRWLLRDGRERLFEGAETGSVSAFREREYAFPATIRGFLEQETTPEEMTYARLASYTREARAHGYDVRRYEVDLYAKLSYPLLDVIVGLLAIPIALRAPRSGGLWRSIGTGLLVGFACWVVLSASLSLGRGGVLPPLLSAWLPDLLFASAGVALLRAARR